MLTKRAETHIKTAMGIYQAALDAAGHPVRSVDIVRGFVIAGVDAKYMEPARKRLGIRSWEGKNGFIWLARFRMVEGRW